MTPEQVRLLRQIIAQPGMTTVFWYSSHWVPYTWSYERTATLLADMEASGLVRSEHEAFSRLTRKWYHTEDGLAWLVMEKLTEGQR